jgi:ribonuclease J
MFNFKPRPLLNVRDPPVGRQFVTPVAGKEVKVGDITLTLFGVDHSVLGAAGCVIRTRSNTIVYTGDLRWHGKLGEQSKAFASAAANADPDIMICEGTRIDEAEESTTEESVKEGAVGTVREAERLVIADFAFRDITRLTTFYEIAEATGRQLVLSKRDAYLMDTLRSECELPFQIPSTSDKNILVYVDRRGTGTYSERDYDRWERPYLEASNSIRAEEVREREKELIIHLTFFDISELVDIDPAPGACYIHSASEPYHEEQRIDEERLNNWLNYFKVKKYHYHASGHASGLDIQRIVETVKPKLLVPIHTEKPELFRKLHNNVKMPMLEPFLMLDNNCTVWQQQ